MEIIKSDEDYKKHNHPFFEKYLLTREICHQKNIPQEINKHITQYHIALKNNYLLSLLKNKNPTLVKWCDAHIPLNYYHLLNNTQIQLLQEMFRPSYSHPTPQLQCSLRQRRNNMDEHHYFLQSEEDYQLFLTLPIEIRKCLTKAPNSLTDRSSLYKTLIPTAVNAFQVIQVKNIFTEMKHVFLLEILKKPINADFFGYIPQLIVPEEKNPKNNLLFFIA
jgi:hypothetical protein